jgi:hypothetical protein
VRRRFFRMLSSSNFSRCGLGVRQLQDNLACGLADARLFDVFLRWCGCLGLVLGVFSVVAV